jgi:hypothetical protein
MISKDWIHGRLGIPNPVSPGVHRPVRAGGELAPDDLQPGNVPGGGSGGATAVTRGLNGNIPPRVDSLTQVPATLIEWHDKTSIHASENERSPHAINQALFRPALVQRLEKIPGRTRKKEKCLSETLDTKPHTRD